MAVNSSSPNLKLLIPREVLAAGVQSAAGWIDAQQTEAVEPLLIVAILKSSICFVADLIRQIKTPFHLDFIRCSSYGMKGVHKGELQIQGIENLDLKGRRVLLVDDIVDSGETLQRAKEALLKGGASSVETLVLLSKNSSLASFVVFEIPDQFVVGYGMDYKEELRGLLHLYALQE